MNEKDPHSRKDIVNVPPIKLCKSSITDPDYDFAEVNHSLGVYKTTNSYARKNNLPFLNIQGIDHSHAFLVRLTDPEKRRALKPTSVMTTTSN